MLRVLPSEQDFTNTVGTFVHILSSTNWAPHHCKRVMNETNLNHTVLISLRLIVMERHTHQNETFSFIIDSSTYAAGVTSSTITQRG